MNSPLVSILIRSTDRATLAQTLASVAKQHYDAIQVWVVAATDGHTPLPAQIGRFPLKFVATDVRLGRAQAANKALALALALETRKDSNKGIDHLALFLDDDDWIEPEHISALVQAFQSQKKCRAVYSQAKAVGPTGEDLLQDLIGMPYERSMLLSGNFMVLHSVLFDLALCQLGCRFDEQLELYEDWDFWLQISQHTDFLWVSGATAIYRIHPSSGVHLEAKFTGPSYQRIYKKWRHLWSPEQVSDLMTRNWESNETAKKLTDTQLNLANTQLSLANTQAALSQSESLAQHLQGTLDLMQQSRSWRWTQWLRKSGGLARKFRQLVRQHGGMRSVIAKSIRVLWQQGPKGIAAAAQRAQEQSLTYTDWISQNEPPQSSYPALNAQWRSWHYQPLVSILMPTYNSPLKFLELAIESVKAQVYSNWQLCIADDASTHTEVQQFLLNAAKQDSRIRLVLREQNGHISECSNSALSEAKGEWVVLLDHDDQLHPLAIFELVQALQNQGDAHLVFSDVDKIDDKGLRSDPYFKTDYNPELMWAQNMISHLGCYKKSVLDEIGGFRKGFEGSQDYDLALRVIQRSQASQIVHIPKVLYHWRAIAGSTALAPNEKPYAQIASRKALAEHLNAIEIPALVAPAPGLHHWNRVRPVLQTPLSLISIIIPTKDKVDLLQQCIDSIQKQTTYPHYEILVVDNNSQLPESFQYFEKLQGEGIQVLTDSRAFNFSALNNMAVQHAKGEYLCLMNNDIEILTSDWIEEMLSFAQLEKAGAVGARLWYPQNQGIQHAGVVIGIGGVAGHAHLGLQKNEPGYFGRPVLHHRCSAVTAACLMIKKTSYLAVKGMDEGLAVAFNDIDFCLRLGQAGFHCIYTPYAEMTHHESATRGYDLTEPNRSRFMREVEFMKARWGQQLLQDPFYSPNLSLEHSDFRMAARSRLV